jgi:GGDEF domain-containing protein
VAQPHAIFFSPDRANPPAPVREWVEGCGLALIPISSSDELMARVLRGRPVAVVVDARGDAKSALSCAGRLKRDSYTGVIPAAVIVAPGDAALRDAFDAGADEVVGQNTPLEELRARLTAMLRRAERDVQVHPSTRLPGAPEIEAEISRRLANEEKFAVCYADLDHFKEFNDRYSYFEGDRVIRILAKILHDVVKGVVPDMSFVGHIGGDDFIYIIPVHNVREVSEEIVSIFDCLVPFQYSEQDRRAGYFFGKDRRGQLHRVPLMTVSIGIVTNERRTFTHSAQVSELATEMKSYAKTLPGSVYIMDRRHDAGVDAAVVAGERER